MRMRLYTFGHGTNEVAAIAELLREFAIGLVCDVRLIPNSRRHPQFAREAMEKWIPEETGIRYRWVKELGGFRKPRPDSPNIALRHPSFRGYADYMQTPQFKIAFEQVLAEAEKQTTAMMCSETLWWRCHRRLISDAAMLLHDVEVLHIAPHTKPQPHQPTEGARRENNHLIYDRNTPISLFNGLR